MRNIFGKLLGPCYFSIIGFCLLSILSIKTAPEFKFPLYFSKTMLITSIVGFLLCVVFGTPVNKNSANKVENQLGDDPVV